MNGFGPIARRVTLSAAALVLLVAVAAWLARQPASTGSATARPISPNQPVPIALVRHDGLIRVALTRRPVRDVRLRVDGPCRVVALQGDESVLVIDKPLSERTVAADEADTDLGDALAVGGGVEIVPDHSPAVWIDGRKYRGAIRLHVTGNGRLVPVNVLPLEDYVAAVVDSEMPAEFPAAAREAQAIVARTYAVSCQQAPPHRWFDLYSTPVSQNYLGVVYRHSDGRLLAGETSAGRAAAVASSGIVCVDHGNLFRTFYSACCGGRTASGAAVFDDATPALCGGVECDGCDGAPLFRWQRTVSASRSFDRLSRRATARAPAFGTMQSVETRGRDDGAVEVLLSDGRRTVRLDAAEVRSALSLPSLMYDLSDDGKRLVARGRGHGHGVGLCQWGAKGLAERGLSTEQILKHYYPGCTLGRLP